jgi:ubiquinone biosynthesis protein UbiJ
VSGGITVALARRLIADAPWAQARLQPFAGHLIAWDLAGVRGRVLLDPQGLPSAAPPEDPAGAPVRTGVRLTLAAEDLAALGQGFEALMRCVSIEGNAGLASELAFVARHLQPEPEEWLAPWLGDALAQRAGTQARAGLRWGGQLGQRAARVVTEFAVHEARLLAEPGTVGAHCAAVDDLREAVDRLNQRIARLERGR